MIFSYKKTVKTGLEDCPSKTIGLDWSICSVERVSSFVKMFSVNDLSMILMIL